jgi:hypothetical protein
MVPMGLAIDWPAMSGAEPWMLVGSRCDARVFVRSSCTGDTDEIKSTTHGS